MLICNMMCVYDCVKKCLRASSRVRKVRLRTFKTFCRTCMAVLYKGRPFCYCTRLVAEALSNADYVNWLRIKNAHCQCILVS